MVSKISFTTSISEFSSEVQRLIASSFRLAKSLYELENYFAIDSEEALKMYLYFDVIPPLVGASPAVISHTPLRILFTKNKSKDPTVLNNAVDSIYTHSTIVEKILENEGLKKELDLMKYLFEFYEKRSGNDAKKKTNGKKYNDFLSSLLPLHFKINFVWLFKPYYAIEISSGFRDDLTITLHGMHEVIGENKILSADPVDAWLKKFTPLLKRIEEYVRTVERAVNALKVLSSQTPAANTTPVLNIHKDFYLDVQKLDLKKIMPFLAKKTRLESFIDEYTNYDIYKPAEWYSKYIFDKLDKEMFVGRHPDFHAKTSCGVFLPDGSFFPVNLSYVALSPVYLEPWKFNNMMQVHRFLVWLKNEMYEQELPLLLDRVKRHLALLKKELEKDLEKFFNQ